MSVFTHLCYAVDDTIHQPEYRAAPATVVIRGRVKKQPLILAPFGLALLVFILGACGDEVTPAPATVNSGGSAAFPTNPAATPTLTQVNSSVVAPTATTIPPTAAILPTATPIPPTATALPPTATPIPPTATFVPATATKAPPTATPPAAAPPAATAAPRVPAQPPSSADSYPCLVGQIKGNHDSGIYHMPGQRFYSITRNATVRCYDTEEQAQAAGLRRSKV